MSTVAYPETKHFAKTFANSYKSAVCSGIVGDRAHQRRGGYHIGRAFQPGGNYSVVRPDDRSGPNDAATAVDMTMNRADMILCTKRLIAVYENDRDPRRKYINAFNGWLGSGQPKRFDLVARKIGPATIDHRQHVHLEFRRKYARVPIAYKAVLSALRGESQAQWLLSIGVEPITTRVKANAPAFPGRVLSSSNAAKPDPALKAWQSRMVARGWKSIGKPDGKFGPKTTNVVRRYQKTCKVPVDGKIGPATWPLPWTRPLG